MLALERKSIPIVAWYMLSKESYMKRVMRDVLPTESWLASRTGGPAACAGFGGMSHTALFAQEDESGDSISMAVPLEVVPRRGILLELLQRVVIPASS